MLAADLRVQTLTIDCAMALQLSFDLNRTHDRPDTP
jgi:hypothetical protein